MSGEIWLGADGYHLGDENFYKVTYTPTQTWIILDKTGTQYFFEQKVVVTDEQIWRWMLKRVVNRFGEEITYSYDIERNNYGNPNWVYLSSINYPHGRYRIFFVRDQNRADYKQFWYYQAIVHQRSLLSQIRVEQDNNGDGIFETLIRKYVLSYASTTEASIFSSLVWDAGGRTPTLVSVQEFGLGGTQGLPPYTFEYADDMHLTSASNGYGATITFDYDAWHDETNGNFVRYDFLTNAQGWKKDNDSSYVLYRTDYQMIEVLGTVKNPNVTSILPGRYYKAVASVQAKSTAGDHKIQVGFGVLSGATGGNGQEEYGNTVSLSDYYMEVASNVVFIPTTATKITPLIKSTGANFVDSYFLIPLPTYYRVVSKTLAVEGSAYTWTYSYDGAAMNNTTNTVSTGHPYNKPFTEFRGHSSVVEIDPYGTQTVTVFNQDDCTRGRAISTTIKNASGVVLQESTSTYECTEWDSTAVIKDTEYPYKNIDFTGMKYRWVRTVTEEKSISGAVAGQTTTTYAYGNFGNLVQTTEAGSGIPTRITHTEYFSNADMNKWLVSLPAREWITDEGDNLLAETLYFYDGAEEWLTPTLPTQGILTATRTLMNETQYSQTRMAYDAWGNVTAQTTWSGYGNVFYDPPPKPGLPETRRSSAPTEGARTSYTTYDSIYHTYAISTTDPLGHITTVAYDYAKGLPTSETDPNGATTTASYDEFGRFTGLTRPGDSSPSLSVSYQNSPFVVTLTQTVDATHTFTVTRTYDGLGRQTLTNTNGVLVNATFDAFGRVLTQSTPHIGEEPAFYTITTYDALGRPLTATAPDGTVTSTSYNGLTTTVTDANGLATTTVTDVLGRTLSITPPTGPAVAFTYDALGNMLSASRGGATMTLTYDIAGRKQAMSDPDMGNWSYTYDALGSMTSQTDARACVTNLSYDMLNRLTGKTYSNCPTTPSVTFTYDQGTNGIGRRTAMTDGSGSSTWLYDTLGRLVKETKSFTGYTNPFTTEWTYNSADLPVTMKYPDGESVNYTYDSRMLLDTITGASAYVTDTQYDSAGRLTSRALGNGLTQAYHYYTWNEKVNNIGQGGRLETLATGSLQNLAYVYDKVGNITQMTNSLASETNTYSYDALDRLTSWTLNSQMETYSYHPVTGNLVTKAGMSLQYNADNHAHAATNANGNTYQYDANGNQVTRQVGSDTFTLQYDAENRLVGGNRTGVSASFTYDGDGQRVKSVIGSEIILFIGNYFEKKGSQVTKYYLAGATRIAMRKYTIPQNMTVEYLFGDHLGSTSITTDTVGAKVSEMRYKPWGELRYWWTANPATTPAYTLPKYTFTGQFSYMDDPSTQAIEGFGLMFYNARWYDPALGRFAQADTIIPAASNSQSWDRFAYVGNNPCRNTDPDGHCWPLCTVIIGAVVSGVVDAAIQYHRNKSIDWKEVAVAATIGGVAGLIGAAVIAPLAEAAGAFALAGAGYVASAETALAIGVTTELVTGATLSAASNVVLSSAHRELDRRIEGGNNSSWASYINDMEEHWEQDAFIGATSSVLSAYISEVIPATFFPPQNVTQSIIYSGMQGAGIGVSNTDLLNEIFTNMVQYE
jgi:RHS repeat-associated protein